MGEPLRVRPGARSGQPRSRGPWNSRTTHLCGPVAPENSGNYWFCGKRGISVQPENTAQHTAEKIEAGIPRQADRPRSPWIDLIHDRIPLGPAHHLDIPQAVPLKGAADLPDDMSDAFRHEADHTLDREAGSALPPLPIGRADDFTGYGCWSTRRSSHHCLQKLASTAAGLRE